MREGRSGSGGLAPALLALSLLALPNPEVVTHVVRAFEKHVTPDRLSLDRCVELGLSHMQPIAALGWRWARGKLGGDAEMFLFGTVLDRFLEMFSNINAVHQLVLQGLERNVRYQWDVRTGQNRLL